MADDPPSTPTAATTPGSALEQKLVIYDVLQHPDAVRWAPDGRLAVLLSSQIEICQYPGEEMEPYFRHHLALPKERQFTNAGVLDAETLYQERDAFVYALHRSTGSARSGAVENVPLMFCALDWSPRGCAWEGGCLLATLTTDAGVDVWAPPRASRACTWDKVCTLSDAWAAYVQQHKYMLPGMEDPSLLALLQNVDDDDEEEEEDGEERKRVPMLRDPKEWAARQHILNITTVAWAKDRLVLPSLGRQECTLLATGGPRLLVVWAFMAPGSEDDEEEGRQGCKSGSFNLLKGQPPVPVALTDAVGDITQVAWMPRGPESGSEEEGLLLAAATSYGSVHLFRLLLDTDLDWRLDHVKEVCRRDMGSVQALRFGTVDEDRQVLVAAKDTRLQAWMVPDGASVALAGDEAHQDMVTGLDWCRAPDGSGPHLVSTGMDGAVKVWQVMGGSAARMDVVGGSDEEEEKEELPARGGQWRLEEATTLSALIPTRREMLMGVAVSPNNMALALARVGEGDEGNRRILQFNRRLRKNHCVMCVQPLWQTGWRSVVLPEDPQALFKAMGWTRQVEKEEEKADWPSPLDLAMVAYYDFRGLMEAQVHPDFLAPQGTNHAAPAPAGGADGEGGGEGSDQDDQSVTEVGSVSSSKASRLPAGPSSRVQWRAAVDLSRLPGGSHDILPHTVFQRLVDLLGGGEAGAGGLKPTCVWQALHAVYTHLSLKFFAGAPHYMEEYARMQLLARAHLVASYIDRSMEALFASQEQLEPPPKRLTREEKQIVRRMAQWVHARLAFFAQVDRPTRRQGGTWEDMVQYALVLCAQGPGEAGEEHCLLCEGVVPLDPMMNPTVACAQGHVLSRCMETLRVVESVAYWECPLCNSMACPEEGGGKGGGVPRPAWLRPWHMRGRGVSCLYCHVPCQLVNT